MDFEFKDKECGPRLRARGLHKKRLQTKLRNFALFQEFLLEFPDEDSCMEALLGQIPRKTCLSCPEVELVRVVGSRNLECSNCGICLSLTAGTFFHGIVDARPWWAAIWMLGRGADLNAYHLHQMVGNAYSTAWTIMKKIGFLLNQVMAESSDLIQESSASFVEIFRRRSIETPVRQSPGCEEDLIRENSPSVQDKSKDVASCLAEPQRRLLELLSDVAQCSDSLSDQAGLSIGETAANLAILELEGLVSRTSADGFRRTGMGKRAALSLADLETSDSPRRTEQESFCVQTTPAGDPGAMENRGENGRAAESLLPANTQTNAGISGDEGADQVMFGSSNFTEPNQRVVFKFMEFILCTFDGIARKYLQIYLALFWCRSDRRKWDIDSIRNACRGSGRIRLADIRGYVTPLSVKLKAPDSAAS